MADISRGAARSPGRIAFTSAGHRAKGNNSIGFSRSGRQKGSPGMDRLAQMKKELEEEVKGLRNILSVAQVVVSSLDLDEVLQNILCSAMAIMDMPAGSIALYEESKGLLSLHAHAGLSEALVAQNRWHVKEGGLSDHILREGELFVVEDTASAPFFNNPLAVEEGIRSLIAVPLKFQRKIVGILYLDDFSPRRFPAERLATLSVLASFATMSIDNARLHERTRKLACTDGLTGLYNHRQFKQIFRDEMARAQRYHKPLSLIMLDIDNFKAFNDCYGHPCGDKALQVVADLLRECLRESDHLCRYGGEEFIAVLPETDIEEALVAAERSRRAIEEKTPVALAEIAKQGLTVSIGVAASPRDGQGLDVLLKVVDDLLYMAKSRGKNKVYHLPEGH